MSTHQAYEEKSNNLSTNGKDSFVHDSVNEIEKKIESGKIYEAKKIYNSTLRWCLRNNRVPHLKSRLKETNILNILNERLNEFLASGSIQEVNVFELPLVKLLGRIKPEEISDSIKKDFLNWESIKEIKLRFSGYSSDVFLLRLILYFLNFSKVRYLDLVEMFKDKYPRLAAQAYRCTPEEDKEMLGSELRHFLERVKIEGHGTNLSNIDFSKIDTLIKQAPLPKVRKSKSESLSQVEELSYLHHFIEISMSIEECLDSLILNEFYYAAEFYLAENINKLSKDQNIFYTVVILNWFDRYDELEALIEKNHLYNTNDVLMSEFYLKVLKQVYEKR